MRDKLDNLILNFRNRAYSLDWYNIRPLLRKEYAYDRWLWGLLDEV